METVELMDFYKGKRVLITGHTGFKGSWLIRMLKQAGALVTGYSLPPEEKENLFHLSAGEEGMDSVTGDIRDLDSLSLTFQKVRPEIVFHMAAQPLVSKGYEEPVETYQTNVMGTVNLMECVRRTGTVRSLVNVTTDKVYENREWCWGYREEDSLCGKDPYSNSKSCSELVTRCYQLSWLKEAQTAVSTLRSGNVIGGGDFAENRILPDCVRAVSTGRTIIIRSKGSVRPYQHVLEPLTAYLEVAKRQWEEPELADSYNIGPDGHSSVTTAALADMFCRSWGGGACWEEKREGAGKTAEFAEARLLKLESGKISEVMGIVPVWSVERAVEKTVQWTKAWLSGEDVRAVMDQQITQFLQERGQI